MKTPKANPKPDVPLQCPSAHPDLPGARLLGVVPNMLRQVNEHKAQMKALVEMFVSAVWPPLPLSVRVAEACAFGKSLYEIAPDDPVTVAMRTVVDRLELNLFSEAGHD